MHKNALLVMHSGAVAPPGESPPATRWWMNTHGYAHDTSWELWCAVANRRLPAP
jgi:hypothetical protein